MHQPAILAPVPTVGRALAFDLVFGRDARPALERVRDGLSIDGAVLGIGEPLTASRHPRGLRAFPAVAGRGCSFPSTQRALWVFFGGATDSELYDRAVALRSMLGDDFELREEIATFKYRDGRDLSGYLDGTANPEGDDALDAAIVHDRGAGLDGSSFVAVQRWVHELSRWTRLPENERDDVIGRRHRDNEEMQDAPVTAHVKRAAMETFDPPANIVRRSMPWGGVSERGLYFIAYGTSLDPFERILRRMAGLEDEHVDALLSFTRAVSGGYYWCPPVTGDGKLDLRALF